MAHPCASAKPPSWCTKKRKRKSARRSCACPSGFKQAGIICRKGRKTVQSSCAKKRRR